MGLTLRPDSHHPAGGHAILAGPGLGKISALSVENVFSSQFLGADGKWGKLRHAFAVAPARGEADALCLGPEIVDHILTDLMIALRDGGGVPLGRIVWPDSVAPRRDAGQDRVSDDWAGEAAQNRGPERVDPLPETAVADLPEPDPIAPPNPPPPIVDPLPLPVARRRRWLIPTGLALAVLAALVAWSLRPRSQGDHLAEAPPAAPPTPVPTPTPPPTPAPTQPATLAERCAKAFDAKVLAAQDAPDSDRVRLAEEAIGASCGAQAFGAVDGTRWETNEPAAWYQARFSDPDETAPVFRDGHPPDARAALDYYAHWAARSPRQAEALKALCAAHPEAVGDNAQRKRACAR